MPPDKKCIKCGWIDPSVGCIARCGTWPDLHARGYGTDATHIPEMLAWLMQFADVETVSWRDLTVEAATINSDRHRVDARRRGATIQQALARLVVEVAEQQMKGAK